MKKQLAVISILILFLALSTGAGNVSAGGGTCSNLTDMKLKLKGKAVTGRHPSPERSEKSERRTEKRRVDQRVSLVAPTDRREKLRRAEEKKK